MNDLSPERLREVLHYAPETGVFTWLRRPVRPELARTDRAWNTKHAGKAAGSIRKDSRGVPYLKVQIDGNGYRAHRLAFLYMAGELPSDDVDHEDRNTLNNAWNNLRAATRMQNCQNRSAHKTNKSGLKGVWFHKRVGRYQAGIQVRGKTIHLGTFSTARDAHAAYADAAKKHFGEFARAA